jgi:hypothetical protein
VTADLLAYATKRAVKRHSLAGERLHAVERMAHVSGALDTECGHRGALFVGVWDPEAANACPNCVRMTEAS